MFTHSLSMTRLTPRKVPRQQRAAATRDRLLDAAARVFAEHGYSAGTTNRIADEAGVSVGSLYQYFPNKDSILVELARRHVADGAALVASHLEDAPGHLEGWVRALVTAVVANHADAPRLHQVLFEEAPRPPELLAELHALEQQVVAAVASLLDTSELRAWLVVAAVESLTHRYVSSHPDAVDLDAFTAELTGLVLAYLGGTTGAPGAFQEVQ